MEELLKLKNMKNCDWIRTPKGASGLYHIETLKDENLFVIISNIEHYKQRKDEMKLYKLIHKFQPEECPKVVSFIKKPKQVCLILEWKDTLFMEKIINYYSNYM
jgi:hypothetical protein